MLLEIRLTWFIDSLLRTSWTNSQPQVVPLSMIELRGVFFWLELKYPTVYPTTLAEI